MDSQLHKPTLRVINVLNIVDKYEQGLTFSDISEKLNIPKSTLSPILKTLVESKYLEIDEKGCYKTSFQLFQLGMSYSGHLDVMSIIRKQMENIVDKVGEITQFGVLIDDMVLYLEKVNTNDSIEIVSSVGKKLPARATGLGKALLSGLTNEEIEKLYDGVKFTKITENTKDNLNDLIEEIEQVRKNGYALDNQEISMNMSCVAVPIKVNGKVKGAMSVTYPMFRKTEGKNEEILDALLYHKNIIEKILDIQKLDIDFA